MGEKDKTQKILESYNDVFADIVNVLLFHGKRIVSEEDLVDQTPLGYYKASGEIHEQERDIAKRWMNGQIRIASYGIENQMRMDRNMPVRALAYDVTDLHAQILKDPDASLRPLVTLVLYYGHERRWGGPRSLKERLTMPSMLEPFVSDYRMHLFEIAYLTREQVEMFQSDFRIVADYLIQRRMNHAYNPGKQTMRHVREILELLCVMEDDSRFMDAYNASVADDREHKGEIHNMCDVLDRVWEDGVRVGRERMQSTLDSVREEGARSERERIARKEAEMQAALADKDAAIQALQAQIDELKAQLA